MKKLLLTMVACVMAGALCLVAGCGKSENGGGEDIQDVDIIGTWDVESVTEGGKAVDEGSLEFIRSFIRFVFTADGTCSMTTFVTSEDDFAKWSIDGSTLLAQSGEIAQEMKYASGKITVIDGNMEYVLTRTSEEAILPTVGDANDAGADASGQVSAQ